MTHVETYASFWDHLEELRQLCLKILIIVLCGWLGAFLFFAPIFKFVTAPLQSPFEQLSLEKVTVERLHNPSSQPASVHLPNHAMPILERSVNVSMGPDRQVVIGPGGYVEYNLALPPKTLVLFGPTDGVMITFSLSFWMGLCLTSPLWLYGIYRFISPALHLAEKLMIIPFFLFSLLFFSAGLAFAYLVTLPLANSYLYSYNQEIGVNLWGATQYIQYTVLLLLANGVAFEISLVLFFLVGKGIIGTDTLISKRRHMIVAAFILAMLLTPPDVPSQFMLALPLLLLYEMAILFSKGKSYLYKNNK